MKAEVSGMNEQTPGSVAVTVRGASPDDYPAALALMRAYVASLDMDLSFQSVEEEFRSFPGKYAEPGGTVLVAVDCDGSICGCVALRKLEPLICEMKRLFVADSHKGQGIGRALVAALIAEGRKRGYRAMRLDTLVSMEAALSLYRSFDFKEIPPYVYNPLPGALYLEKDLS